MHTVAYRLAARQGDVDAVRRLVVATGFFNPAETDVAAELVQERLAKGPSSGYEFIFAEREEILVGYTCYGSIPGTSESYDLYWIAVHPGAQGMGLGRALMQAAERQIRHTGGRRVYVETSSRVQYDPTRAFYLHCGYAEEARLADFYSPGDAKVIYLKVLPR